MTKFISIKDSEDLQDFIVILITGMIYGLSMMLEGFTIICSLGLVRPSIIGPVSNKIVNFRWQHINKPFGS